MQAEQADKVYNQLSPQQKCLVQLARERGSSSWFTLLPLKESGLHLHKGEFRDAICLRYGWILGNTPQTCSCRASFSVDHAVISHTGGFKTPRHNEVCDIRASLLTEVCHIVTTKPPVQSLCGEPLTLQSANTDNGAQLDIRARGFWNIAQDAFV